MDYTPMGVSPSINILVYTRIGGSPKNKVNPFEMVVSCILNPPKTLMTYMILSWKYTKNKVEDLFVYSINTPYIHLLNTNNNQ